jgi:hypothetical protein
LPVAGLDQGLEFPLGVAPVEEFIDQFAVDLPPAVLAHPDFVEFVHAQQQAHGGDVLLVLLGGVGVDQPVVPRLADHEPVHERPHQARGPAGQGVGLQGQADARAAQGARGCGERFGVGRKPGLAERVPVVIHAPEQALPAVQVEGGIDGILLVLVWWMGRSVGVHRI